MEKEIIWIDENTLTEDELQNIDKEDEYDGKTTE